MFKLINSIFVFSLLVNLNGFSQNTINELVNTFFSEKKIEIVEYTIKNKIENNPNYKVYYLQQKLNDIDIHNAISTISVKNEMVKSFANRFISKSMGANALKKPKVDRSTAIQGALNELNINGFRNSTTQSIDHNYNNIEAKLIYLKHDNKLKLCWNFNILTADHKNWYDIFVDSQKGGILKTENWIVNCEFNHKKPHKNSKNFHNHNFNRNNQLRSSIDGSVYRVVSLPSPSPNHGPFELLSEPANLEASPYGWHDTDGIPGPEYTITRGNNVYAKEDDEGDGSLSGTDYSPDGGSNLNFDFSADLEQQPSQYMDASITNLFYVNNMMHDIWFRYGFDEASGNFQENNYGNGGFGSDSVNADGQDGSGLNNASFGTPPDGQNPQMTMFLWSGQAGEPLTILNGSLAGEYTGQPAAFGESLPDETPLVGELALIYDSAPDVHDACNPITNIDDLSGKIVVIRRGLCEFGTKILSAENAGAIAVIMVNNVPGGPITMGAGVDGGNVSIPSIMISQDDGSELISQLQSGDSITASLINAANYTDSDFDNEIIAHEYGHGISNRLMGGAQAAGCMQNAEQQGEGFSDWFGLMITLGPDDSPSVPRGVATYSVGQSPTGNGIRNAPYSPDFFVNDYTYADSNNTSAVSQPHGVGFVFATMLWDLTWAFIDEYGYDSDLINGNGGNNKVMQLVIDALKLSPCSAGFVDMRDAILLADELTNNSLNECLIWNTFANRGLGYLASQGDPNSRVDQIEDFSIPPFCEITNEFDAGVISIDSPQSGFLSSSENITITIRNFGANTISDFDVYFQVNGGEQISETTNETVNTPIISGTTLQYTFETTVDFSIAADYEIIAGTLLENDEDNSNNSMSVNVVGSLGTYENDISNFEYFYNPKSDILSLSSNDKLKNIQLYNIIGQKIIDEKINKFNHQINLTTLPKSIYFVKVESENGLESFKLSVR